MASPASVANLGSARVSHSSHLEAATLLGLTSRRTHVISRICYSNFVRRTLWMVNSPANVCNCMVTTKLIDEKGISTSLESTYQACSVSSDKAGDVLLKAAPKPVLKGPPNGPANPVVSISSPVERVFTREMTEPEDGDREKVIKSLGEVLEKAEKLEMATPVKLDSNDISKSNDNPKPDGSANVKNVNRRSRAMKSVWRKGNPVASVQKVVKKSPDIVEGKVEEAKASIVLADREPSGQGGGTSKNVWRRGNPVAKIQGFVKELPDIAEGKVEEPKNSLLLDEKKEPESSPVNFLRPQKPLTLPPKPMPKLQTKPAVTPPSPHQATATKPSTKQDRKPILIDKYGPKKPVVDPFGVEDVLAPTKPVRGTLLSKFKEGRRKKSSAASAGLRKRLAEEDDFYITEEDASEFDVFIPGVRKGRKWTKASRKAVKLQAAKAAAPVKVDILEVGEEGLSSEELAYNLTISEAEIFSFLYSKGIKPDAEQMLGKDMVKMICKEFDVEVIEANPISIQEMAKKKEMLDEEDYDLLELRPPIITIMGHVDHGKTTLLDYIRNSKVVASEAGGITQGIGAYKVQVLIDGNPHSCVFLDTPGHEAFGAMRARGARVTDIAIIVVAADDGVRPQTNEAIAHARAAGVPIIVAINKIDKEGASPERVMQELSQVGLMAEEWGGDIPMVKISALKGDNVDELLETVMLVAELQELKANPHRKAKGTCIEAALDKSRGPVSSLIVQNGTLRRGDIVVCGGAFGRVRALFDDRGVRVEEAGPSMAVQVIGLSDVSVAGDEFEVLDSLDMARARAEACAQTLKASRISAKAGDIKITLSSLATAVSDGKQSGLDRHQLNIILKVDVQGSIEAIRQAIQVLPQDNVTLKFILQAPGDVSTSDVDLAVATEAIIFGFNVKASSSIKDYACKKNVEIRLYRVIYDLLDDIRNAMEGLLEPVEEEVPIGVAEVRATFSSGSGRVAGCMVTEGKVEKSCHIRVLRNKKAIYTGKIDSLRRVKEGVKEVNAGLECGIGVDDFTDWEVGDIIETFQTVKKKRTLEEASSLVAAALAGASIFR
ncbi:hypothetical protein HPP92_015965 [Vanilla planifolia]|uniref:Translation initiation factor IF-2, chloroplastic n=1 Tax=Vanilla planifolia TaxID=51239 RepID=A0A835QKM7_VANPL|nr:hypothetical protein HPP92_015965 [Vanilla planifolia]